VLTVLLNISLKNAENIGKKELPKPFTSLLNGINAKNGSRQYD
jgi:hypothetical protein